MYQADNINIGLIISVYVVSSLMLVLEGFSILEIIMQKKNIYSYNY